MPDTNSTPFSQLSPVSNLSDTDIFALSAIDDTQDPPVYVSYKTTMLNMATRIIAGTQFNTLRNQTVENAINELYGLVLTDTLEAGETTLTFTNQAITTNSTLDNIWASVFGIFPTDAVFATGSLTLTFDAQANDIEIKVRIT